MTKWKFAIYKEELEVWLPMPTYFTEEEFEDYAAENELDEEDYRKLDFTAEEF